MIEGAAQDRGGERRAARGVAGRELGRNADFTFVWSMEEKTPAARAFRRMILGQSDDPAPAELLDEAV